MKLSTIRHIPKPLYWLCQKLMPIVTVDIVVFHGNQVLLLRRAIPPSLGHWALPGGRILRNETLGNAVRRKLKQETHLTPASFIPCGVHECFLEGRHNINITFLTSVNGSKVTLDFQHSFYSWMSPSKIPQDTHPVIVKQIQDALKIKEV